MSHHGLCCYQKQAASICRWNLLASGPARSIVQGPALLVSIDEPFVLPHDSSCSCGEADSIRSHLWHKLRSRLVRRRSAGNGSSWDRGGGAYGADGDAQAVITSAQTTLSSRESFGIFGFLRLSRGVGGGKFGAQGALARQGGVSIGGALLLSGGGGCGIAGIVRGRNLVPVPQPAASDHARADQRGQHQALKIHDSTARQCFVRFWRAS